MAFNPIVNQTLLIGGRSLLPQQDYPVDAWKWDGKAWKKIADAPRLYFPFVSYDQARKVVVAFGWGPAGIPETWTWDGKIWTNKSDQKGPTTFSQSAMCFDQSTQKLLLYGGWTTNVAGGISSETWLWDGGSWSQAQPAHVPGPRIDHVLSCGPNTVLFGGVTNQQATRANDTWVWNGEDWHQVATMHTPPDCCGTPIYDGTEQMVFWTGHDQIPRSKWNQSDWVEQRSG
jgi:hypothetical protein